MLHVRLQVPQCASLVFGLKQLPPQQMFPLAQLFEHEPHAASEV